MEEFDLREALDTWKKLAEERLEEKEKWQDHYQELEKARNNLAGEVLQLKAEKETLDEYCKELQNHRISLAKTILEREAELATMAQEIDELRNKATATGRQGFTITIKVE